MSKPSWADAPNWVDYLAQDGNGRWYYCFNVAAAWIPNSDWDKTLENAPMLIPKTKPWRSEKYKAFVRKHPCSNCGIPETVSVIHAHHINGQGLGKGGSDKISDCYTIPLCPRCHNEIHRNQEMLDQKFVALKMFEMALQEGVLK